MDIRQHTFLASQPSAVLQNREHFWGIPRRGLALLLANAMFWQPLLANADGIVASGPGTRLDAAGNGVPIVNIAAANGSGLSHNQFKDYNVGAHGVILNNAIDRTQSTQLGGIILGNSNLRGGAAHIILNEVNGGSPSQLRGYTEVAGQAAKVIVANPYGITCDGCGFINTPHVTLTTGRPILDNGRLDRYQVDGGAISIDSRGLDASNIDRFEIITRSARINAQIHARQLTLIAGRNDVNAQTLTPTARAADGSATPELAIDSSALGGMYAGAIKLVGTEAGVGVKLDGTLAASAGDIRLDANGHLTLAHATAHRAIDLKAASLTAQGPVYAGTALSMQTQGDLNNHQTLAARDRIQLTSAGRLTNHGIIEAGINTDESRNATGDVSLSASHLRNLNSVVASRSLAVTGKQLDNSGGSLNSQKNSVLTLSGDLENAQGLISSAGQLSITTTGAVDNRGGRLVTDGGLDLRSASFDNRQKGVLKAQHAAQINTGSLSNQHDGQISSDDTLGITAGQLNNGDGGHITAAQAVSVSVTGLDQQGGKLTSQTALTLDVNRGQLNNQKGLITGPLLVLKNLKDVNNQGGEISSSQGFTLTADNLDSSTGKLLGKDALTLRISQVLTNTQGLISAATVNAQAGSLDNSGGTLTSLGDVSLDVDGPLTNQDKGLINAANTLRINSAALNNQRGSLQGQTIALDFGSATGDLNNTGGGVKAADILSISHLRDLINHQDGEVSSAQSLTLSGRTLDNSGGKLISNKVLTLNATSLLNQRGLMSGWQGLSVSGADLDNRDNGKLSSLYGHLDANLSNSLLNRSGGTLVSQKTLKVTTAHLDNSDNGVLTSGAGQTLTVSGLLNNAQGGLIESGTTLDVRANRLDNSAGTVIGKSTATLDLLGPLTNTHGTLTSGAAMLVKRAGQIDNQGGEIASQGRLTLLTGSLDNRNSGTLVAHDTLSVNTTGAVQNSNGGKIHSQHADVRITAASLDNTKGTVHSQSSLALEVSGDIDNQGGKLIAHTGDLKLTAANLDNRAGTLASLKGTLDAGVTGLLRNSHSGLTQGQWLKLNSDRIDNSGGRISALAGHALVTASQFDNRNGALYGKGAVKVSDFDNSGDVGGQVAGGQIELTLNGVLNNRKGIIESDSTLSVSAGSVDNQSGQLRALGDRGETAFRIGGLFDNRHGVLEAANHDFSFQAASFQNTDGNVLHVGSGIFGMAMANLNEAGGNLVTRGSLTVDQDTWTNSSAIQAGRLTVNVNTLNQTATGQLLASRHFTGSGVNWTTDGLIASEGDFDLTLSNTLNGRGRATSRGAMTIQVGQLSLSDSASISSGGPATLNVQGLFSNAGRLTSASDLHLSAAGINNSGTLGSAQTLTLTTGALLNEQGLIFSGGDMHLRVDSLTNSYADIYSLGNLVIDRDGQGRQARSIINRSAHIQSDGHLSLAASTIQNIRAVLTTENQGVHTARISEIACLEGVNAGDCSGKRNHVWEIVQRDKVEVTQASAASSITSGGDLTLNGGDLLNQSSTIATAGNLVIAVDNLTNSGIETGETETTRVFTSQRTRNAGGWHNAANAFTQKYWFQSAHYTANDLSGLPQAMSRFIGTTESELPQFTTTQKRAEGDQRYAAVIQAGGTVNVTVGNTLDNSVVRAGYTYIGSGPRTDTQASGADFATRITLNQQLPPDLAQQQVNPLTLPGFTLPSGQNGLFRLSGKGATTATQTAPHTWTLGSATIDHTERDRAAPAGLRQSTAADSLTVNRVQGLPDASFIPHPQKYLIETNPALTDLKQFMGSDYLLSNLGYNPDQSQKRLGDGFYEQRLIQQALIARTGQRFIDGQTSDAAMFKHLMDNAVTSKQALNLAVGISLTREQVAALTHDIVWLENADVGGQQVLVPVLYLAQAHNRLAPNGALIAGNDVNLIAGKNLNNVGTLRATSNLTARVGNHLVNSGLIEADDRLNLLASNNLTNTAGGIVAGRDINLTAVNGDILNERTVTRHHSSSGYRTERSDVIDNAARIEAANKLTLQAGRDINNVGSVISSGVDTELKAGRDVNLIAAEQRNSHTVTPLSHNDSTTQYGSVIEAGRDFQVVAARNISAIASQIQAKRDITLAAEGDLILASGANEQHSSFHSKKVKRQQDHVSQVSTVVTAGGDVTLSAGQDLALIASRVVAGDEAYLVAGGNLGLLAGQDSDYSLYDMKKKGGWGSKKTQRDEVTDVKNIGSEIKAGGDLTLVSAGNQLYQAARLDSGHDLSIVSGGAVTFEAVKDLHQESHEKSESDLAWTSAKGKGRTDETVRQTEMIAQGSLAIKAVDGLHIDIKHIDQHTVSQAIDVMVKADPQLAWLKEAEKRGDVDWQHVQEMHDSFKYSHASLGQGAMLAIIIIVTVLTAGAGSLLVGSVAGATASSGTVMAAGGIATAGASAGTFVAAGWGNVMATSALTSLASGSAVSFINNGGNIGATLKDVTSSNALKGYATAALTAGFTAGVLDPAFGVSGDNVNKVTKGFDLGSASDIGQFLAYSGAQGVAQAGVGTALQGGSLSKNLGTALTSQLQSTLQAVAFNAVGKYSKDQQWADSRTKKIALHALVGGLLSQADGGSFATGALAAGANEALITTLAKAVEGEPNLLVAASQLVGIAAAGATEGDVQKGDEIAKNATEYNFLEHLPPGLAEYGQAATSLADDMRKKGATVDEIAQAQVALAQGQGFDGAQPANEFVKAWGMFMAGELTGAGLVAVIGRLGLWGAKGVEIPTLVNKPLGLGSTGRSTPANLSEKLAMEQAISNPAAGRPLTVPMTDPRWPATDGWVKSAQNINGIEIHYVKNSITGAIDDFKFK
ncbi:MAG TPA: DUF637 domain-containing protein [Pseudomonas sp.]|uniref:two-partner secretion domain-containing protein n=1 Tax=Pseudomonas sp. TaxID=306 RepID=UPI002ED9C7C3